MANWVLSTTSSDLGTGDNFSNQLVVSETASTIALTITKSSTEEDFGYTNANVPYNDSWETGNITVYVDISTGDTGATISCQVHRVNSSGTIQESTSQASAQTATAGVKTFSWTSQAWSSGATGDRLMVEFQWVVSGHQSVDLVIDTGTGNTRVETSITQGTLPTTRRIFSIN